MGQITVTEALAELKTLNKRIEKKRGFMLEHICRPDTVVDPLVSDGGQEKCWNEAWQSHEGLWKRYVDLRVAIQRSNLDTQVQVGVHTASVAFWLSWRRDQAAGIKEFRRALRRQPESMRANIRKQISQETKIDVICNVSELQLAEMEESHEELWGELDGKLSLLNATTFIDV